MRVVRGRSVVSARGLFTALVALGVTCQFATSALADDATAPLRRFPVSLLVRRPGTNGEQVSLLRLDALRPKDEVFLKADPSLAKQWTFVFATLAAGQRIQVKTWNLWEKEWKSKPVTIGRIPEGDVVPLFFLVLNPHHEVRVRDAIQHSLESASEQIISGTANFQTIYQQQNRLLNFMSAYAALGPKTEGDPTYLNQRIAIIDADLGMPYDPTLQQTQPGDLQHGLDAGVGILGAIRDSPDNPAPAAILAQSQLPAVVSDWVGLVGDLMHIFIKPPHQVKLSFTPASCSEVDPTLLPKLSFGDDWMQLVTERVLDSSPDALPTLVFRPGYKQSGPDPIIKIAPAHPDILAGPSEADIPLGPSCSDLFLHPWSWDWEESDDGTSYAPIPGAHLVPGRGLVIPTPSTWWNGADSKKIWLRARVGYQSVGPFQVEVGKVYPQKWTVDQQSITDIAAGDGSVAIKLSRSGHDQSTYRFATVSLVDAAGRAVAADSAQMEGGILVARFGLGSITGGTATIHVHQEGAEKPDEPTQVFIAPRRPSVELFCGRGDKVLRLSGPDASWVKTVDVPSLAVKDSDNSDPANRKLTMSAPLPETVKTVSVTFKDPSRGWEWTRTVPIAVGLPRPMAQVALLGTLPSQLNIGAGPDSSWATATMPPGWFSTKQPVRIQLNALPPFSWSHDVTLELGLGSAGDVQLAAPLPEGSSFALDQASPDAYVTLNLDTCLPQNPKRRAGIVWLRLSRSDLASPWTLAFQKGADGGVPIRGVLVPVVQSVDVQPTGTKITLSDADDVLGVKFVGQALPVVPQLAPGVPKGILATFQAPPGATEFDLLMRDASDGVIHVTIVKVPK